MATKAKQVLDLYVAIHVNCNANQLQKVSWKYGANKVTVTGLHATKRNSRYNKHQNVSLSCAVLTVIFVIHQGNDCTRCVIEVDD
jgi:hypothetical protein